MPVVPPRPSPPSHRSVRPRGGRSLVRATLATVVAAVLALLGAAAASAHVRVIADSTTAGSYAQLTFRVPNESDTAGTVGVTVTLPQDTPLLHVSTTPVPGWTATVEEQPLPTPVTVSGTTITKAPRTVTWTAAPGTRIEPGQYLDLSVSAGPLPTPGTLTLPATQAYSDGTVVAWDQPSPAGGAEPEHPAPTLTVTPAGATAGATAGAAGSATTALAAQPVADTSDPVARTLAAVALAVAVLGVGVALGLILAGRRRSRGAP